MSLAWDLCEQVVISHDQIIHSSGECSLRLDNQASPVASGTFHQNVIVSRIQIFPKDIIQVTLASGTIYKAMVLTRVFEGNLIIPNKVKLFLSGDKDKPIYSKGQSWFDQDNDEVLIEKI